MSSILFKRLVIFSPVEELAKSVCFESGLNIVTSARKDGNDLGKSLIAKSLYHCLGADCKFDSKFDAESKVFVLLIDHNGTEYAFYRNGNLFKLFDAAMDLLWTVSDRNELGRQLFQQFGFAIWFPARFSKATEIAPPAYSYAPYFVDQNQYDGSVFRSFHNLGQYASYKKDLIFTFVGALDKNYYDAKSEKESLDREASVTQGSIELNIALASQINEELSTLGYSSTMDFLERDCDEHESDYKRLSEALGKLRGKLFKLREERAQLQLALNGAEALGARLGKNVGSIKGGVCPLCRSQVDDPVAMRVNACVAHVDALILGEELQRDLNKTNEKIGRVEELYDLKLKELNELKSSMEAMKMANITATQIEGLTHLSKKLSDERGRLEVKLDGLKESVDARSKRLREYSESKKEVNERYVELIAAYVGKLNLQSIDLEKVKGIENTLSAAGSNAPLVTVAWHFTLLMLKDEFNPDRICLPLVLDSPMNVEADDQKYERQYDLIFKEFKYHSQMIVTGLGLANSSVIPKGANVIVLDNPKYHLLCSADYETNKQLLFTCMEKH